jgi:hypothetical protein
VGEIHTCLAGGEPLRGCVGSELIVPEFRSWSEQKYGKSHYAESSRALHSAHASVWQRCRPPRSRFVLANADDHLMQSSFGAENRPKVLTFKRVCHLSFPQCKENQFAGCDILQKLVADCSDAAAIHALGSSGDHFARDLTPDCFIDHRSRSATSSANGLMSISMLARSSAPRSSLRSSSRVTVHGYKQIVLCGPKRIMQGI